MTVRFSLVVEAVAHGDRRGPADWKHAGTRGAHESNAEKSSEFLLLISIEQRAVATESGKSKSTSIDVLIAVSSAWRNMGIARLDLRHATRGKRRALSDIQLHPTTTYDYFTVFRAQRIL